MTNIPAFDLDALLAPLSSDAPGGEDMSFSSEFDAIQEARREDDPSLDQGDWVTAIKEADWPEVMEICDTLLRTRTKDLRLASWYTEAAGKTLGVAGLAHGFQLMEGLLDRYWESLHPLPEDGDLEQRIGNLSWLITRCKDLSRELPLVNHKSLRGGMADLDAARAAQARKDAGEDEGAEPRISLQQFRDAQKHTPAAFHERLLQDCKNSRQALDALSQTADRQLGMDGPSFTPLRDALDNYASAVERIARENGVGAASTPLEAEGAESMEGVVAHAGQAAVSGPIRSREQALQQLRQVADYFRRTEPHSPVAYLADKAARWGSMPLHEWLRSVLKEDAAMARFEELLGVEGSQE